jgi:hypothetical protein
MPVVWEKHDVEYFHQLGIAVDDEPEPQPQPPGYVITAWFFFWLTAGGMSLYGILLAGAWLLRHLGVNITGI